MSYAKRLCSIALLIAMITGACGALASATAGTVRGDALIYADTNESFSIGGMHDGEALPGLSKVADGWYKFSYQGLNIPIDGFIKESNVNLGSSGQSAQSSLPDAGQVVPVIQQEESNQTVPVIQQEESNQTVPVIQQDNSNQTVPVVQQDTTQSLVGVVYPKAKVTIPTTMTLGMSLFVGKGSGGIVEMVSNGKIVDVLSAENEWTRISTGTGQGYAETKYLMFQQSNGSWAYKPGYGPDDNNQGGTRKHARVILPSGVSKISLYPNASTSGTPVTILTDRQIVQVISTHGDWTYVDIGNSSSNSKLGYVQSKYLEYQKSDGTWPSDSGNTGALYAYVNMSQNNQKLNLRDRASLSGAVLGQYYSGTQLVVLSWGSQWTQVRVVSDNKEGYMQTQFLSLTWPPSTDPTTPPTDVQYAVVNNPNPSDWLNLRAQPSTASASLGQYYNGTTVKVYEYGATWCYVEVSGKIGYMMTRYLNFGGIPGPTPTPSQYATVNNPDPRDRLNLRERPTTASTSLGRYYNGTTVSILEYGATWCYVEVSGKVGYMMTRYLNFGGTPPKPDDYTIAYVNNPVSTQRLNLRAQPSINSASLGQFYNGTAVKVYEYGATWCYVEAGGMLGYMTTRYLNFSGSGPTTTAVVNNPVSTQRLNLRAQPSTSSASLGQYYNGTVVRVLEYGATWCYVQVGSVSGYMMTRYLRFT